MAGKLYQIRKEAFGTATLELSEAITRLQGAAKSKFNETVEIHINLGVEAEKSDQMVRGSVTLPHGTPTKKKIVVFTNDEALQAAAKDAGAHAVGGEKLIEQITKDGTLEADITVATPDMMAKIAKVAKILGPKGLMPNPKTGTVSANPAATVAELLKGKVSFKMDSLGNIHESVAKLSWDADKIAKNIEALIAAVRPLKPANSRGAFVKKVVLKSTMSPAIQVKL